MNPMRSVADLDVKENYFTSETATNSYHVLTDRQLN